ncbi:hypothetical protein MJN76_32020, partial [Salmonella enterica subsp. enterica serovar Anatum]|nr:hypothetical protein [Salmonella enterica subsp. enterica serovar Anatum]
IVAGVQAMQDSGLEVTEENASRIGAAIGSGIGGLGLIEENHRFLAAGASFNQMVTALERMMTSQQRLLSDISHELRTPLTRLQL